MSIQPGDDRATGRAARGHLLASHAGREQVIGTIKAAFVQGMLGKDEFDLRVGQALASRTCAELAALTADLPAGLAGAQPPKSARVVGGQPVLRPGQLVKWATGLYAGVWTCALLSPNFGDNHVAGPVVFVGAVVYLGVLVIAVVVAAENRWDRRRGGQPPRQPAPGAGGQAFPDLPPAGPARPLPPAGHGRRHTADATPVGRPRLLPS